MSQKEPLDRNKISQTGSAGKNLIQVGRDYIRYIRLNIAAGNWVIVIFNFIIIAVVVYGLGKGTESVVKLINESVQKIIVSKDSTNKAKITSLSSHSSERKPISTPANPFKSVSFPLDSCGDQLPKEDSAYPVSFYPVFISYSDINLSNVKSKYCRDSFKKYREKTSREEIQVASFTNQERANQFKQFIFEELGSGEVGELTIVEAKRKDAPNDNPTARSGPNQAQAYSSKTITQPLESKQIELDCSPANPGTKKYQELDVIINVSCINSSGGIFSIEVTNYSTNVVEIEVNIPNELPTLIMPDENKSYRATISWNGRDIWQNRPNGRQVSFSEIVGSFQSLFAPYKLSMSLRSYTPSAVTREVTVKCSDKSSTIWGIEITPQCVPPGLRATYENVTSHPISVGVVGLNEPPIYLQAAQPQNFVSGGSASVKSSSEEVTLSIIANP
jgi:serine/threonine-protein kinase